MKESVYDVLKNIVAHTHAIGVKEPVKIIGNSGKTTLDTSIGKSVLVQAEFKKPVSDFSGTFGLPNLHKLNTILNIPVYDTESNVSVKQNDEGQSDRIHFSNKDGDFTNDYRLMGARIINAKVASVEYGGTRFDVVFVPDQDSIQRLKYQSSANSEVENLIVSTENNNLEFSFGNMSTFAGKFVFAKNVGTLRHRWGFPVSHMNSILNLSGNKEMSITDEGAAKIVVDSGIAVYTYYIPGISI